MKKRETLFKEKIRPQLEGLAGSYWVKTQQVVIRGTPDFLGCVRGQFVALELKVDGGELSGLQEWNLERIIRAGGMAVEVTPRNWPGVFAILEKMSKNTFQFKPDPELIDDEPVRFNS